MEDKFDRHIRETLNAIEVTPPEEIWTRIEASLDAPKKSSKGLIMPLLRAAVAAAILLALLGLPYLKKEESPATESPKTAEVKDSKKLKTISSLSEADMEPPLALSPEQTSEDVSQLNPSIERNSANNGDIIGSEKTQPMQPLLWKKTNLHQFIEAENTVLTLKNTALKKAWHSASMDALMMSQNAEKLAQENENWDFSPSVGSQYALYNKQKNKSLSQTMAPVAGGLNIGLFSRRRWHIQTGIYYARFDQKASYSYQPALARSFSTSANGIPLAQPFLSTSWGDVALAGTATTETMHMSSIQSFSSNVEQSTQVSEAYIRQQAAYIELPISLRYTLIDRAIGVDILGAYNNSILIDNSVSYRQEDEVLSAETKGLKSYSANGIAGMAFYYKLNEHLNITVEPQVKYYFNGLSQSKELDFQPLVTGIYTGLTYHF